VTIEGRGLGAHKRFNKCLGRISSYPPAKGGKSPPGCTDFDGSVRVVQTSEIDGLARSMQCQVEMPGLNMGAISAIRGT